MRSVQTTVATCNSEMAVSILLFKERQYIGSELESSWKSGRRQGAPSPPVGGGGVQRSGREYDHLPLVPRLIMRGVTPQLYSMSLWRTQPQLYFYLNSS